MLCRTMVLALSVVLLLCPLNFAQTVFEGEVIFIDIIAIDNTAQAVIDIKNDGFRAFAVVIPDKDRNILASDFIISNDRRIQLIVKNDSGNIGVGIVVVGWGPKDAKAEVSVQIK